MTEINEPLGFSTGDRVEILGKPWLAYRLVGRLLARWASLIRPSLPGRRHAHFDVVIVGYLGHFDVTLARLCIRAAGAPWIRCFRGRYRP